MIFLPHHKRNFLQGLFAPVPAGFNLDAFQQTAFEGEGDTRRLRIEEKEYNAVIEGPWGEEGKTRLQTTEKGGLMLVVVWRLDDEEQRQKLGLERMPTKRQTIFLDLTPNGALDMGEYKNADLNRLREAIGLRQPGQAWKFPDFVGRPARIKIENRTNKEDPDNPFQNVTAVSPLQ